MSRGFHGGRKQGRNHNGYGRRSQGNKQRFLTRDIDSKTASDNVDNSRLKNSFVDLITNSVHNFLSRSSRRNEYDISQETDSGTFTRSQAVKEFPQPALPVHHVQLTEHLPKAVIDPTKCNGCEDCIPICPVDAISLKNGQADVTDECIGCGVCEMHCQQQAIEIT
ncbi:indolepyruvate ferredoxin oxidoreductase subunit alpha [candidate division CSSED10-310 bacterium]|uniref:Indolepyruvate ferredoxin oxidoreductase subunit alpha n=1 Tax=candidate division CSSED10-310 bacterium TaxID=2855610 RepID=A0ABV6Z5A7_UNCC1